MRQLDGFDMLAIASLRSYGTRYVLGYLNERQRSMIRPATAIRVRPVLDTELLERDSVEFGWRDLGGEG